jgi:sRNA-binding carbon storage regulator CsrA
MAINATNNGTSRELIPAGNYAARCYQMIEIGTVSENVLGKTVIAKKVRIGWELPTELKVFREENGEQPLVISKEYTLSMNEKSNLRKDLKSWRGKDFTEDEARCFDITKLLGAACMLNIIHKPSASDPTKVYEQIAGITGVPKGMTVPAQLNKTFVLSYDQFDMNVFNSLPDFIKNKMQTSAEYSKMVQPNHTNINDSNDHIGEPVDDLPF